jgi:DNA repair protein RecO (recombination protein O)
MDWQDEGIVIGLRLHGETSAIVEAFSAAHGRHSGVVRGGASRKKVAFLQPGAQVALSWRARIQDHLGAYTIEPIQSRATLMEDRAGLAALNAVCALLHLALPEREAHPGLYAETTALLDKVEANAAGWQADYPRWEIALLQELGFALDLSCCAVTGAREGLDFVSPRSGRAVSRAGAGDWASRLLPLPHFLREGGNKGDALDAQDMASALRLTGHFLTMGLEPIMNGKPLPEARARLFEVLARQA